MHHTPSLYPIKRNPWEETFSTAMAPGPPTKPDIYSFTRPFLQFWFSCLIFFLSLLAVGPNWPVYGGTGRQNPTRCPTCTPRHKNLHIGAVCQRSCFTKMEGRGGGMTKTTACVGEHCLQLRLEIFSEKKDLIHNGRGCEKRGHILKEVPLCVES